MTQIETLKFAPAVTRNANRAPKNRRRPLCGRTSTQPYRPRLFINPMCPCKSLSTFGQCCPCPLNRGTGTIKPYQNRDRDRSYGTAVPIHVAKVVPRTCPNGKMSGKMVNCWGARPANPMPNIGNRSVYNFHSRFTRNTIYWARSSFRSVVRSASAVSL